MEGFAVGLYAADGDATEINPVVAALAPYQSGACALPFGLMIGQCDFQCGVHGLGTGVGEEGVIESGGG